MSLDINSVIDTLYEGLTNGMLTEDKLVVNVGDIKKLHETIDLLNSMLSRSKSSILGEFSTEELQGEITKRCNNTESLTEKVA